MLTVLCRFMVSQGCIPPLCDLLSVMDHKVIQVALNGLENILRIGEMDAQYAGPGALNPFAHIVEECQGKWCCCICFM